MIIACMCLCQVHYTETIKHTCQSAAVVLLHFSLRSSLNIPYQGEIITLNSSEWETAPRGYRAPTPPPPHLHHRQSLDDMKRTNKSHFIFFISPVKLSDKCFVFLLFKPETDKQTTAALPT